MNFNTHIVKLKTKTWARDSYSLFDYETNNYFSHSFEIQKPGYIMRDGNEIVFVDEKSFVTKKKLENHSNLEQLAFITEQDGNKNHFLTGRHSLIYQIRRHCSKI